MEKDLERRLILTILGRTAPEAAREVMGLINELTAENERLRTALKNASSALDQIASGEATWSDGDVWAEDARAALEHKP